MNKCIDSEIILNRKIEPIIYIYIMIIIIITLSLIIFLIIYHYKTYYKVKGIINKDGEQYYVRIYVPLEDIKYIVNNEILKIDNKNFNYKIIEIDSEYFTDSINTYEIIKIDINLPENYKHENLTLDLKIKKEDKRVIDYIIKKEK